MSTGNDTDLMTDDKYWTNVQRIINESSLAMLRKSEKHDSIYQPSYSKEVQSYRAYRLWLCLDNEKFTLLIDLVRVHHIPSECYSFFHMLY